MINTDFHVHCDFSNDSSASMESMVNEAVRRGFKKIAFTDHLDFYPLGEFLCDNGYDEYLLEFNKLKTKYADNIELVFGVEVGLDPKFENEINEYIAKYPFEFIIGSSHTTGMKDHYLEEFFRGKDKKTAHTLYFREVLENIRVFDCFNCYGHLDYISRYGPYQDKSLMYDDYQEIIDKILRELIIRGKGVEINTSGFRYGIDSSYPSLEILKVYKRLGGEIITVGSDAHVPEHLGWEFKKVRDILLAAGFEHYTVFSDRQPEFVRI